MKYVATIILILSYIHFGNASDSFSMQKKVFANQENEKIINDLENKIDKYKEELLKETISSYQQTNDRINNYLTFTTIIATIFGVIIAFGGIFIGFESIKSSRRREEAIKTLEEAKKYVEDKKSEFDQTIDNKLKDLEIEYQKILTISKERLEEDINIETQKVKDKAQMKSQEIEDYSIDEKTDKKMESLQKRIQFFENIGIPDDPKILFSKAKILMEKEMNIEAIELLKKLIEIEPSNSSAFWQLGWVYSKMGNTQESIFYYQKSIELNPNDSSSHNNLGWEYEKFDKPLDALREFDKAIELNNTKKLYYTNKIRILKILNSIDEVMKTYNSLLNIDKKDSSIYNEIVKYLGEKERLEEAIKYIDLGISEIDDKNQEFNFLKALIFEELKRYDESINIFQNLIDQNHKTEQCYIRIANIKYLQNMKDEALDIIDLAISLNPKNATLYSTKVSYQLDDSEEEVLKTIFSGAKQIQGELYFQSMARTFAEKDKPKIAKKLYLEANKIVFEKLGEKKEVDIMNYYEGLIITKDFDKAKKFIIENESYIVNEKYKIIRLFDDFCIQIADGALMFSSDQYEIFEKYVENENFIKVNWLFDDILYSIKEIIDSTLYKNLILITELLKGKVNIKDFKSKIE